MFQVGLGKGPNDHIGVGPWLIILSRDGCSSMPKNNVSINA